MTKTTKISFPARLRRWTRVRVALALPLATLAVPVLAASPADAATSCTVDCVTVNVQSGVDRFKFDVTSGNPVRLAGRITTADGKTTIYNPATNTFGTSYPLSVSNLPAGTSYRYDLYATDTSGNTWKETGYFSTLVRDVSAHFTTLQLTDAGDAGGDGEIVAGVQLIKPDFNVCQRKPLAPFNMTSPVAKSSGSFTVGTSSDLACAGSPAEIWLQAHMADDDTDPWDDCSDRWPWAFYWGSWGSFIGSNSCANWNYSHLELTDPLPALGAASKSVSFTSTSADGSSTNIIDVGPEWVLSGTMTWSHHAPAVSLPATTGAPANLGLTVTPKVSGCSLSWTAQPVAGLTVSGYLVQWRVAGTTTWSSMTAPAGSTSAGINGLAGGTPYEIQVLAQTSGGLQLLRSGTTITPLVPIGTNVSGFDTTATTGEPYANLPFAAKVTGDPRPVELQVRRSGTETWTTQQVFTTTASDDVSGSIPVLPGINEWRLYAAASGSYASAASAVRTVTAGSSITGFSTAAVSKPAGAILKDAVTVTPGEGRQVLVQYKKKGAATWSTYQTLTASEAGEVTANLKAFAGSSKWRVRVVADNAFGTAAMTATRTVEGR